MEGCSMSTKQHADYRVLSDTRGLVAGNVRLSGRSGLRPIPDGLENEQHVRRNKFVQVPAMAH